MRIAVSGTHFSGKSTLIALFQKHFPSYSSFEDPYYILEEEGYEFLEPPSLEDFEQLLFCSMKVIHQSGDQTIFDRCPLDFVAYAQALAETRGETVPIEDWIDRLQDAMDRLDLIIFLPIEEKDRILVPKSQDKTFRKVVDEKIRELILDDFLGILDHVEVLEVTGTIEKRFQIIEEDLSERGK